MQGGANKYAGLTTADVDLFEYIIQIGRELRCYPGHEVAAEVTGQGTRTSVSGSFNRLERAGLIARDGRGSNFSGILICASGRRVDVSRARREPPRPARRSIFRGARG